jgi:hypothetical protein
MRPRPPTPPRPPTGPRKHPLNNHSNGAPRPLTAISVLPTLQPTGGRPSPRGAAPGTSQLSAAARLTGRPAPSVARARQPVLAGHFLFSAKFGARLPCTYPAPVAKPPKADGLPCTYPTGPTRDNKNKEGARPTKSDRLPCTHPPPDDSERPPFSSLASPTPPHAAPSNAEPGIGEIEAKDGLPSADRNNKATLLLTGPFRTAKSSAKDLTPLVLKLQYAKYRDALPAPRRNRLLRR